MFRLYATAALRKKRWLSLPAARMRHGQANRSSSAEIIWHREPRPIDRRSRTPARNPSFAREYSISEKFLLHNEEEAKLWRCGRTTAFFIFLTTAIAVCVIESHSTKLMSNKVSFKRAFSSPINHEGDIEMELTITTLLTTQDGTTDDEELVQLNPSELALVGGAGGGDKL